MADRREGSVPVKRTVTKRATALQRTLCGEGSDEEASLGGSHRRSAAGRERTLRAVEASPSH
eukprot:10232708-Prorocentrum_lima.AAC.1